ncbi:hypothetical protein [Rhizobium sp. 18065]|uniref:hypothetical protein n=1 Tax=Rhizobium sp. 18065 TaxID=2681411 RepID=UPI00135A015A|nr:hypothetical protein [Rhizobium sp. 18065]
MQKESGPEGPRSVAVYNLHRKRGQDVAHAGCSIHVNEINDLGVGYYFTPSGDVFFRVFRQPNAPNRDAAAKIFVALWPHFVHGAFASNHLCACLRPKNVHRECKCTKSD